MDFQPKTFSNSIGCSGHKERQTDVKIEIVIYITFVMLFHFSTIGNVNAEFLVKQFYDLFTNTFNIF